MKKHFFLIAIILVISNIVLAQFTINQRPTVYNQTDSTYMCVVPDSLFYAKDYPAIILNTGTVLQENIDTILSDTTLHIYQVEVCDTLLQQDTIIACDSIIKMDTIIHLDTTLHLDSIWHCDTIYTQDTLITQDTIYTQDTIITCDSIIRVDSMIWADTIVLIDSMWVCDTLLMLDTLITYDSITRTDSIILFDTIYRMDTLTWKAMQIDDDSIALCGDSITFRALQANKKHRVRAILSNDTHADFFVQFTNLPLVVLEGDFGYNYASGNVHLYLPDTTVAIENMPAKIKWRGGSTNNANRHKRNYTIKFVDQNQKKQPRQFFNLRTHNQWILNAGQIDLSRCRNQIAHELWQDIARPPYYIDQAPEAITNVRGRFVEVLLNNEYRGLYSMTENVDQAQMQVKEYDDERGIIHGQLWKADNWDGTSMHDLQLYNNRKETYRGFETKYPDFEDVNPTDYSTLYNAIKFVLNSSDEDFAQHLGSYFDIPVLIDYYIFINFLVALDNNGKNMFWACYDKQEDPKLTIGAWDLDCTVGQNYTCTDPHPDHFGPEVDMRASSMLNVLERMRQHPMYLDSIHHRYWQLRETHLHVDSLIARYENYFLLFERGGADYREEQRWSGDTDVAGLTLDLQEELAFIKDWIVRRLEFLDNGEFAKIDITTNVVSTSQSEPKSTQYYNLLGVPVSQPKSGIYIKDNKKILIP
jgi:hypothetical protein